jgi:hypothetical protein
LGKLLAHEFVLNLCEKVTGCIKNSISRCIEPLQLYNGKKSQKKSFLAVFSVKS